LEATLEKGAVPFSVVIARKLQHAHWLTKQSKKRLLRALKCPRNDEQGSGDSLFRVKHLEKALSSFYAIQAQKLLVKRKLEKIG
jgi:hypothetical protein